MSKNWYIITKRIYASSLQDAVKKHAKAEIVNVAQEQQQEGAPAIGFHMPTSQEDDD